MSAMRNMLGDFTLFKDGIGKAGQFEEISVPELNWKMDDYDAGGLLGTREIATGKLEKMTLTAKSHVFDRQVMSYALPAPGATSTWKLVGSLVVPGEAEVGLKVTWQGALSKTKRDSFKAGKVLTEFSWHDVIYYEERWAGSLVWKIDLLNYVLIGPDGVDRMQARRRNLGIGV